MSFLIILFIHLVTAGDSVYTKDSSTAFGAALGCARCILIGSKYELNANQGRIVVADKAAEATKGSCVQS